MQKHNKNTRQNAWFCCCWTSFLYQPLFKVSLNLLWKDFFKKNLLARSSLQNVGKYVKYMVKFLIKSKCEMNYGIYTDLHEVPTNNIELGYVELMTGRLSS